MALKLSVFLAFVLLLGCALHAQALTQISNCFELQAMKNNLAEDYELVNDIDCSDTVNWDGGQGFKPVGASPFFTGRFDGKGYVIVDLVINRLSTNNIALFGTIDSLAQISSVGLVRGSFTGNDYKTGSLVADNYGSIVNSYATGTVTSINAGPSTYAGGLVAVNRGFLNNCYTISSVAKSGSDSGNGGLVGLNTNSGSISNCYAMSDITSSSGFAGGLAGFNDGTIRGSYAIGRVTGVNVGGLVGSNEDAAVISNCYARGSIAGRGSFSSIGGLVGNNVRGSNITNSYAVGSVSSDVGNGGGLVGFSSATGTTGGSYWDTQTSGKTFSSGGIPKTTAQMYMQATFESWDFATTWQINEGNDYPVLQSSVAPVQSLAPTPTATPRETATKSPVPTPSGTSSETPSPSPVPTENQAPPAGGGSNDGLSDGAIAGIAIGSAAGAVGVGAGLFVLAKKFGVISLGKSSAVTPMQPTSNA